MLCVESIMLVWDRQDNNKQTLVGDLFMGHSNNIFGSWILYVFRFKDSFLVIPILGCH